MEAEEAVGEEEGEGVVCVCACVVCVGVGGWGGCLYSIRGRAAL